MEVTEVQVCTPDTKLLTPLFPTFLRLILPHSRWAYKLSLPMHLEYRVPWMAFFFLLILVFQVFLSFYLIFTFLFHFFLSTFINAALPWHGGTIVKSQRVQWCCIYGQWLLQRCESSYLRKRHIWKAARGYYLEMTNKINYWRLLSNCPQLYLEKKML